MALWNIVPTKTEISTGVTILEHQFGRRGKSNVGVGPQKYKAVCREAARQLAVGFALRRVRSRLKRHLCTARGSARAQPAPSTVVSVTQQALLLAPWKWRSGREETA